MSFVPLNAVLADALAGGYGVPAFNIVNDVSTEAVLEAAAEERSPVILQTSVKTVRMYGHKKLFTILAGLAGDAAVPVVLHLDHCPEREVISDCLQAGWTSVLFDAHELDVAENLRQTVEVVAEARAVGASVEGEIEAIQGIEDGIGSDEVSAEQSLEVSIDFIEQTGVDCFAPAIGNAHGQYKSAPVLDHQKVSDLLEATGVPMALHGGTGLAPEQFQDLVARGCAKVNISTALKEVFLRSSLASLRRAEDKGSWDPLTLFRDQKEAVSAMARDHMRIFGSAGQVR
ncbi:ketose-bisphosphate aldolase [uncultured Friedmanniella sp.]|uniref:class II fructose-bisphosphate aldolase n=1 Tax=uncultured Friedmanniella sp. TaxID=335381 RepID=UPI0035CB48C4